MPYPQLHFIPGTPGRIFILLALLLPLITTPGCTPDPDGGRTEDAATTGSKKIVLEDALGQKIVLNAPATRVISLAPNLTEMVYAAGGGSALVGRTSYCDYPPEAQKVEPVGDMLVMDYEKIISRKPDLVLMTFAGNNYSAYLKLKELGVKAFALQDTTIEGMVNAMESIGTLLGKDAGGRAVASGIRTTIDSIRTLAHRPGARPISTFIVIDRAPLMTVTWGFLVEAITIAGGDNIAKGGVTAYPLYSREELLRRDPEVILVPGHSRDVVDELIRLYPEWKGLRAVRENRVHVISPDLILRPGPRFGEGLKLLYQALHEGGSQ